MEQHRKEMIMKIKKLLWDCDDCMGGYSAEVEYDCEEGKPLFVLVSVLDSFEDGWVTTKSYIRKFSHEEEFDADVVRAKAEETFGAEIFSKEDIENELKDLKYRKAVEFARFCLDAYMNLDLEDEKETKREAKKFIAQYADQDPETIEVPMVHYGCLDDEDEEE